MRRCVLLLAVRAAWDWKQRVNMTKISKRAKIIQENFDDSKSYEVNEAIDILQKLSKLTKIKLEETLDLAVNIGIDARKGDQMVRSMVSLPSGSGKEVKVAVFADGDEAKQAQDSGADIVGMEELAESMKKGDLNYDVVIAAPAAMKIVGQIGRILGPKGLMPNPKDGTVTAQIAAAVTSAKAGQVRIRNDKQGIIHCRLGKLKSNSSDLLKNFTAVMSEIKRIKPKSSKGTYLKKITVTSTMGPGVQVNIGSSS